MPISGESGEFFTAGVNAKHTAGGAAIEGRTSPSPNQAQFPVAAVVGINEGSGNGVLGINSSSTSDPNAVGVKGQGKTGVLGKSIHPEGAGVRGEGQFCAGVVGVSNTNEGMHAETNSPTAAAIAAYNLAPNGTGAAIYAKKEGSIGHAGFFDGDVHVTRSVTVEGDVMLVNADCAEEFTVANQELARPGAVMVIGEDGVAVPCTSPCDHRLIGVVSGAGGFRPALLLDRQGGPDRRPIALMGKVFCLVDADHGAIRPGDLLTTSSTPGHAMQANDATCAPGTIIGKALAALPGGRGLIPILAILQ